jgi:hypothetical protein
MERKILRDASSRSVALIDPPDGGGCRRALDRNLKTLSYYDPKADETYDASYHLTRRGDLLAALEVGG